MKKTSLRAQKRKRTVCKSQLFAFTTIKWTLSLTHLIRVVQIQNPAPGLVDFLVALTPAHDECGIHMHIVACQVERDQALENKRPSWEGGC